jgi:hypothetical protein
VKEYDRSKTENESITNDIDQIMRDSSSDENFHAENVEMIRESDRGYFRPTHVSSFI